MNRLLLSFAVMAVATVYWFVGVLMAAVIADLWIPGDIRRWQDADRWLVTGVVPGGRYRLPPGDRKFRAVVTLATWLWPIAIVVFFLFLGWRIVLWAIRKVADSSYDLSVDWAMKARQASNRRFGRKRS